MTKTNKILLLGGNGLLGKAISLTLSGYNVLQPSRSTLDISDYSALDLYAQLHHPSIIINATGCPKVDLCEEQPALSENINFRSVSNMAKVCSGLDIPLIHFSSDYIFDGKAKFPYSEKDLPNPLNMYGVHKLQAEKVISSSLNKFLILRVSWLYGITRPNFFTLITDSIKQNRPVLQIVDDQLGTPNSVDFIAREAAFLINYIDNHKNNVPWGIFHISCTETTSWYDFACNISRLANAGVEIKPISSKSYNSQQNILTKRPLYSTLNSLNYAQTFNREMPSWQTCLSDFCRDNLN